jgi:hypothetical protein
MENSNELSPALAAFFAEYNNPSLRGMLGRNVVKYHERVMHLDVLNFDIYGYWGKHRDVQPGEDTSPVLCYAVYAPINKEVILCSLPGAALSFTDNLTKARAPHCWVVGNLVKDHELFSEVRAMFK